MGTHTANYVGTDPQAIDALYQAFKLDPDSVSLEWRRFFEGFDFGRTDFLPKKAGSYQAREQIGQEASVLELINEYRARGHLFAKTNPIRERRHYAPLITLDRFGLSEQDLNKTFHAAQAIGFAAPASLQQIIEKLEKTYCSTIGCEFSYVRDPVMVKWLTSRIEKDMTEPKFSSKVKIKILDVLMRAVVFEQFIHSRFVGQKRFSLEGLEALIPALETVIGYGAEKDIKEFVVGMAHRGRLNTMGNIFRKDYSHIFSEFEGKGFSNRQFGGDEKYHLGFSTDLILDSGKKVHLNILPNPSHLEAVNPVVAGVTRAKLDFRYQHNAAHIAPILIHGDASIAGQGVVYELLQMSKLDSYSVGGTIHIVTNNQIGFTTNYTEGRSSTYCCDVAKTVLSPVFHVNADDIEMVVYSVLMALDFRQQFKTDVFIDILGYRKYGHNEGDDPNLTQPILYSLIHDHPNAYMIYSAKLVAEGLVKKEEVEKLEQDFRNLLDKELEKARASANTPMSSFLDGDWKGIRIPSKEDVLQSPPTGVAKETLFEIVKKITTLPEGHSFSKKVQQLLHERQKMLLEKNSIDWSLAEALAFGSLLLEGKSIRFTGEDCMRGTFSNRHAMLRSENEDLDYYPLRNLAKKQGNFFIYNSTLSEYAVMGFEYGYALASPKVLTLWEAQYGDFANGAQIIIDQFLCSAETKWQRMNGLVLLLPHGFEGQAPEHSSARLERFLQLCAEDNMIVAMPTSPASYFHMLRRQDAQPFRKPLVVMTPKSLLRHPLCRSTVEQIEHNTRFVPVLDDSLEKKAKVRKVLVCAGHVYYDLLEERTKRGLEDVAILRLEQFYPFDQQALESLIASYPKIAKVVWVQEEPENQGALGFLQRIWRAPVKPWEWVSRKESASTATGFIHIHKAELKELLDQAFA